MTKVGFVSLGCQEPRGQRVMMVSCGAKADELTPPADEAEVLVVNTCSFIEERKKSPSRSHSGNAGTQKIRRGKN